MGLSQDQWVSIGLTAALGVAYLVGKIIEHVSKRPRVDWVERDGKVERTMIKPKGIDLEFFTFAAGFGLWISFIWMLQNLGAFN